jgi:hypothetical protein
MTPLYILPHRAGLSRDPLHTPASYVWHSSYLKNFKLSLLIRTGFSRSYVVPAEFIQFFYFYYENR